jgi:hypothetical protein
VPRVNVRRWLIFVAISFAEAKTEIGFCRRRRVNVHRVDTPRLHRWADDTFFGFVLVAKWMEKNDGVSMLWKVTRIYTQSGIDISLVRFLPSFWRCKKTLLPWYNSYLRCRLTSSPCCYFVANWWPWKGTFYSVTKNRFVYFFLPNRVLYC